MNIPFWFLLALIPPFLWAIVNHIDGYIISKFTKGGGIGSIIILSSLFSVLVLPIIYFFGEGIQSVSKEHILILMLGGVLSGLAVFFYLKALFSSSVSSVVPIFQTIPVFGFLLGYIFLNELLASNQIFGGILITLGAILISVQFSDKGWSFAKKALFLMLASSFSYALFETLFKFVAIEEDFWVSIFWQYSGLVFFGILVFIFHTTYRKEFLDLLKNNKLPLLSLNALNETATLVGNFVFGYASLLVPVAMVMVVSTYQPVFVFIIGIIITIFWPSIAVEDMRPKVVIQKILSLIIILIGSYYILS